MALHIVTLSFDDGFRQSCLRVAEIYERFGLSACFNVIATGHHSDFATPDEYQITPRGDFVLWNELQVRGHEVMPHGYKHANKARCTHAAAQDLIRRCFEIFSRELHGFVSSRAVFNFPYNSSTPALEAWLPEAARAFRTGGGGLNPLPKPGVCKLTCTGHGPANCEQHLDQHIEQLLARPEGWLIYNTHGLDGEGWGPIGAEYLERLLERLVAIPTVRVLPAGRALDLAGAT